jgi:hypothetical protein
MEPKLLLTFSSFFLLSKTESCYIKMWVNINNTIQCIELGQVLNINIIHLDFKIGVNNAIQKKN